MLTDLLYDGSDSLPALSLTVLGPAFSSLPSAPSRPMTLSAGTLPGSIPESPSSPFHVIVTASLYQPAALAGVVGAPVSVGLVRSILIGPTLSSFVFPAMSTALPMTKTPSAVVSPDSVLVPRQPAIPDSASVQTNLTSTGPLFHPKSLAAGRRLPVIVGLMSSILSVIV